MTGPGDGEDPAPSQSACALTWGVLAAFPAKLQEFCAGEVVQVASTPAHFSRRFGWSCVAVSGVELRV